MSSSSLKFFFLSPGLGPPGPGLSGPEGPPGVGGLDGPDGPPGAGACGLDGLESPPGVGSGSESDSESIEALILVFDEGASEAVRFSFLSLVCFGVGVVDFPFDDFLLFSNPVCAWTTVLPICSSFISEA